MGQIIIVSFRIALPDSPHPILVKKLDLGMVVNNTGKKYCNIQYQYQAKKVLPIPIPITP